MKDAVQYSLLLASKYLVLLNHISKSLKIFTFWVPSYELDLRKKKMDIWNEWGDYKVCHAMHMEMSSIVTAIFDLSTGTSFGHFISCYSVWNLHSH